MRLEIEDAINRICDYITEEKNYDVVDIIAANKRVLKDDIIASFSVPSYPKSAMDGYALFSEDITDASKEHPVKLKVLGQINAGDPADYKAIPKTAVRIMTGAEIPASYDAVIRQELTDYGRDTVEIYAPVSQWENYCKIGEDISEGNKIIEKNTLVNPTHINLIASLGLAKCNVLKKMKIAILSTGSELLEPGDVSEFSRTYNSTVYQIEAVLREYNVDVVAREHCDDDIDEISNFITTYKNKVDVIITTGGVSVGDMDLIPEVMKNLNTTEIFRGVNIKPGTPVTANYLDNTVILSCSGNPFACIVNFQVFFWPMLAKKMGTSNYLPVKQNAIVKEGYSKARNLRSYIRAYCDGCNVYIPEKGHSSSIMSSSLNTNCFVIQKEGQDLKKGDTVQIQYIK